MIWLCILAGSIITTALFFYAVSRLGATDRGNDQNRDDWED